DHAQQRGQVVRRPAIRAEDLQLERPDVADVLARIEAGRGPAGEQAPAPAQATERRHPGVAAREVDDDIHPALEFPPARLAEARVHVRHEVTAGVVDDVVRTEPVQALDLLVAAGAGDDGGAGHLGQEHAAGAHAAAGPEDEDALAGGDAALRHHHAMCGAVRHRQRGGVGERHAGGNADQLMGADATAFGEAAVDGFTHEPTAHAIDRGYEHAIADCPALDARAELGDLAGQVQAHDGRHGDLDAGHPAQREDVVIVERRRAHGHDDLPWPGVRIREALIVDQAVEVAVRTDDHGFHAGTLRSPGTSANARAARLLRSILPVPASG